MKGSPRTIQLTEAGYRITDLMRAGVVTTEAAPKVAGMLEVDWATLAAAAVGLLRRHSSGLTYIDRQPYAVNVARLLRKGYIVMRREPVWSVTDAGRKALDQRDRHAA